MTQRVAVDGLRPLLLLYTLYLFCDNQIWIDKDSLTTQLLWLVVIRLYSSYLITGYYFVNDNIPFCCGSYSRVISTPEKGGHITGIILYFLVISAAISKSSIFSIDQISFLPLPLWDHISSSRLYPSLLAHDPRETNFLTGKLVNTFLSTFQGEVGDEMVPPFFIQYGVFVDYSTSD